MNKTHKSLLILTEDSKPESGGIAEYLHSFALTLLPYYDIQIISPCSGASSYNQAPSLIYEEIPWFRPQIKMRGDQWLPFRKFNTLRWIFYKKNYAKKKLASFLAKSKPKAIIIFRLSPVTDPWFAACRALNLNYSVVVYGKELVEPLSWLEERRRILNLRGAHHVFSISTATSDVVYRLGVPPDRVTLAPPGIISERYTEVSSSQKEQTRASLGIKDRRFIFSLCLLIPRKGIDLAIEAFASIAGEFQDLDYVIAGEGPELEQLKALAKKLNISARIHFIGSISDETKWVLYDECEFFVLPNRRLKEDMEGFGIVFLEAAMYEKASIGGGNGGVRDAIEPESTGLLVDTEAGPSKLKEAMRYLLQNPEAAKQLGQNAKKRALEKFQLKDTIKPFLEQLSTRSV